MFSFQGICNRIVVQLPVTLLKQYFSSPLPIRTVMMPKQSRDASPFVQKTVNITVDMLQAVKLRRCEKKQAVFSAAVYFKQH